jgi:hypothetical protein
MVLSDQFSEQAEPFIEVQLVCHVGDSHPMSQGRPAEHIPFQVTSCSCAPSEILSVAGSQLSCSMESLQQHTSTAVPRWVTPYRVSTVLQAECAHGTIMA